VLPVVCDVAVKCVVVRVRATSEQSDVLLRLRPVQCDMKQARQLRIWAVRMGRDYQD